MWKAGTRGPSQSWCSPTPPHHPISEPPRRPGQNWRCSRARRLAAPDVGRPVVAALVSGFSRRRGGPWNMGAAPLGPWRWKEPGPSAGRVTVTERGPLSIQPLAMVRVQNGATSPGRRRTPPAPASPHPRQPNNHKPPWNLANARASITDIKKAPAPATMTCLQRRSSNVPTLASNK